LDPSSKKKLIQEFINIYISQNAKELLIFKEEGLEHVIGNNLTEQFKMMLNIFKKTKETFVIF
jgi:thiaminase